MIVSIHQPNFFPYAGILEKIAASDIFVIFTGAQYSKGNYHNRFNIGDSWYTMSLKQHRESLLTKMYSDPYEDWHQIARRLPKVLVPFFRRFDDLVGDSLCQMNSAIIRRLCYLLGIKTQIVFDDPHISYSTVNERLVKICKANHATTYLSGPSGLNYMDFAYFDNAGITIKIHHPQSQASALELLREKLDGTSV